MTSVMKLSLRHDKGPRESRCMHSKAQPGCPSKCMSEGDGSCHCARYLKWRSAVQKTLDELIDRGDISTRDLDTRTMDALEGK